MEVISYYDSDRKKHWLEKIRECEWGGGVFLYELISQDRFFDTVGRNSKILLLTDKDELLSFCTYAEKDDIQPTDLTPWIGFVYTYPEYRGHRYVGLLFKEIERLMKIDGVKEVYISTNHEGLYEKYGCEYLSQMIDIHGEPSRIYVKRIEK